MGVMLQAFYWDCPREDHKEFQWWNTIREQIPSLANTGFTALWLPPVHKAGNLGGPSMGYDPYDYYDLGEFDQKGSIPTWFGTKQELLALIHDAHESHIGVIADIVINHNSGADAQEVNPLTGQSRWTLFQPKSRKFPRNWESFHPNMYESWDEMAFGGMPDLSHRNPHVYAELLKLARWLIEEVGFDGFRYDFVKGYGTNTITAIQEYHYMREGKPIQPYGVAEFWDNARTIGNWVYLVNFSNSNPVDAFDFPMREMLKALCDQYGFSLRSLATWETVLQQQPQSVVTFVENHDLRDEGRPIVNDKLLAYSYILTHEGYPCVFWHDYFNYNLALPDTANGISALVQAHEKYAGGATQTLYLDDDLYIMQRIGYGDKPGLIYVLNNRGDTWHGDWVGTQWPNASFRAVAWWGENRPSHRPIYGGGWTRPVLRPGARLCRLRGEAVKETRMVHLVPMTDEEFRRFLEHDIREYAASQVRSGNWSEAEALTRSRREHHTLLKDGLKSKFHHLYTIQETEHGEAVGVLWFKANLDSSKASGFIFDLEIHEPFRRKGYARQAMLALENVAREMGLRQLALHVFAYNEEARALYESLGYTVASLNLLKEI